MKYGVLLNTDEDHMCTDLVFNLGSSEFVSPKM